jgi:uncharacterized protein
LVGALGLAALGGGRRPEDLKWYSFATIIEEDFEFDPVKSAANRDKHGIDFVDAQGLWRVFGITGRLAFPGEERWMRIGRLGARVWSAVFTLREGRTRLISVRRAREDEVRSHDVAEAGEGKGEHDHEP